MALMLSRFALNDFAHAHKVSGDADQNQQHAEQGKLSADFTHCTFFKSKLVA